MNETNFTSFKQIGYFYMAKQTFVWCKEISCLFTPNICLFGPNKCLFVPVIYAQNLFYKYIRFQEKNLYVVENIFCPC